MTSPARNHSTRYTWSDYCSWDDGERYEIIGGEVYSMSPSPSGRHQVALGEIFAGLRPYFKDRKCQPILAPMDVKLTDEDIVQPDILVLCDPDKLKPTHVEGAPDLVVEILSPSTQRHDRGRKNALYARHGVREYWLVTPFPGMIEILLLDGESYRIHAVYGPDETLVSPTFPGLELPLESVFDYPIEPGDDVGVMKEADAAYG